MRAKELPAGANGGQSQRLSAGDLKSGSSYDERPTLRTRYAVHVVATRLDGVQVGQTFATLAAAEKKIARQRERGLPVQATLVQLMPVPWSVIGGDFG